jgi:hypothetical protein
MPPRNKFSRSYSGTSGPVTAATSNFNSLSFVRVGRWEGDLWAGRTKGAAGIFVDERADERQAEVLPHIFGGRAGGFPGVGCQSVRTSMMR